MPPVTLATLRNCITHFVPFSIAFVRCALKRSQSVLKTYGQPWLLWSDSGEQVGGSKSVPLEVRLMRVNLSRANLELCSVDQSWAPPGALMNC